MHKNNESEIKISGICERDIDLLLVDEFISSPQFYLWFLKQILLQDADSATIIMVERSATDSNGESDIELTLKMADGEIIRILIENKVRAGFQPRQAERYRKRGESYVKKGKSSNYRTVLVAPMKYLGNRDDCYGFDSVVSYESILTFISEQKSHNTSPKYKNYLLSCAIEKSLKGWISVEDKPVSQFWESYWKLTDEIAPELRLAEPGPKPSGSSFIQFSPYELPKGILIIHKVTYGNVDLQFSKMGDKISTMNRIFKPRLKSDMIIEKANRSAVVRIRVPKINMVDDFDINEGRIVEGIRNAQFLLQWFIDLNLSKSELEELSLGTISK